LADTSPGTIVISYLFIKGSLFDPDIFRPIYPPNWGFEEEMESKIYVAKRR